MKLSGSISYVVGVALAVLLTSGYLTWTSDRAELARDASIVTFVCGDMAYEDRWRADLHRMEQHLHTPTEDDRYYAGRDRAFTAREAHAKIRQQACAELVQLTK